MTSAADRALAHVRALFPAAADLPAGTAVTVNFHPDRLVADGRTVAECLATDGVYRSQFETGISNGGIGEFRARWEDRMFGGAYPGTAGRPVYGALNLAGHPDGAAPRFGSCHLVLRPSVTDRATFSHGDSLTEPAVAGTAATFAAVWEALLQEVARTGSALAVAAGSVPGWISSVSERSATCAAWLAAPDAPAPASGRAIDWYVEAQIHGGLTLSDDVAAVVADPSLRGTTTEASLRSLGVPVRWHRGYSLLAAAFPVVLRGPEVPAFARFVADRYDRRVLDAEVIGRAARSVVRSPAAWARFGSPGEVLQLVKYLWHILVLLG